MSNNSQVAIIDYDIGNLLSVKRMCEQVGLHPVVTSDKKMIQKSKAVILPGVGAFGDAMRNLTQLDLISPLKDFIASGKPFMGICLGMQLLLSESDEFGRHKGLDVVRGSVVRFHAVSGDQQRIKVPQVGWNRIQLPKGKNDDFWNSTVLKGIPSAEYMYFVHSYYAVPEDKNDRLTMTTYEDITYCSAIRHNNVIGFQFHPEKSGAKGIMIYSNFKKFVDNGGVL